MLASLGQIQQRVDKLAKILSAPPFMLPSFGSTQDFAKPHIEVSKGILKRGYHYVVVERGIELSRNSTQDLDQLLFWIFDDVTFQLACDFELNLRRQGEDSRRQMFSKQAEILEQLSTTWAQRVREMHTRILDNHPFRDHP